MTKRAHEKFKKNPRGYYQTPPEAVAPLIPHLQGIASFEEPCAGAGALVDALEAHGLHCSYSCDIEPQRPDILTFDAMKIERTTADCFITNPPWPLQGKKGDPAVSIALHLSDIAPTWLLLSSDFAHCRYYADQLESRCVKIVSVGRVSWMGNGVSGFDNAAWYLFERPSGMRVAAFYGRAA